MSFVFPRVSMFPSTSSRETLRLSGKQNSLFPSGAHIKCIVFQNTERYSERLNFGLGGWMSLHRLVLYEWTLLFLKKYLLRYFGTRSCKHLKTKIHLFLFLIVFNKGHPNIVIASFDLYRLAIIRAARFCSCCKFSSHITESSPHAASA